MRLSMVKWNFFRCPLRVDWEEKKIKEKKKISPERNMKNKSDACNKSPSASLPRKQKVYIRTENTFTFAKKKKVQTWIPSWTGKFCEWSHLGQFNGISLNFVPLSANAPPSNVDRPLRMMYQTQKRFKCSAQSEREIPLMGTRIFCTHSTFTQRHCPSVMPLMMPDFN